MEKIILMILDAILLALALGSVFCLYMIYRNGRVSAERIKMLDKIWDNDHEDCNKLDDAFEEVSYYDMMRKFWVWPISKMWPDELKKL